ncbi:MAG: hypothetical protein M1343_00090 [Chloroflexi bacterium]|nr:hypothetical protein [Chloroflexota bacterium]MDA8189201.1 hypothetical protein [Dehalococcoidales bacterium]
MASNDTRFQNTRTRDAMAPRRIGDVDDVNDAAVFFVAIILLVLVAIVILVGGNWLFPPTVPSPHL